jgi:hypothetical protein
MKEQNLFKQKLPGSACGLTFGIFSSLCRDRLPSNVDSRKTEESLPARQELFFSFECLLFASSTRLSRMFAPHLHVSMPPHVEILVDLSVLLLSLQSFPLTGLGAIQGGLALSAVLFGSPAMLRRYRRCSSEHDCCLSGV